MDGGAWWAVVHGVTKSQTRLSDFTFTFHFHALEQEMATHSSILAWRIPGTGEPVRLPSVGSHRVGHDWSDLAVSSSSLLVTLLLSCPWNSEFHIIYWWFCEKCSARVDFHHLLRTLVMIWCDIFQLIHKWKSGKKYLFLKCLLESLGSQVSAYSPFHKSQG